MALAAMERIEQYLLINESIGHVRYLVLLLRNSLCTFPNRHL